MNLSRRWLGGKNGETHVDRDRTILHGGYYFYRGLVAIIWIATVCAGRWDWCASILRDRVRT